MTHLGEGIMSDNANAVYDYVERNNRLDPAKLNKGKRARLMRAIKDRKDVWLLDGELAGRSKDSGKITVFWKEKDTYVIIEDILEKSAEAMTRIELPAACYYTITYAMGIPLEAFRKENDVLRKENDRLREENAGLQKKMARSKTPHKDRGRPCIAKSVSDNIRNLRHGGKSIREIARELQVSATTVQKVLKDTGNTEQTDIYDFIYDSDK